MTTNFNAGDDIIDVRDIIARVEELREEKENHIEDIEDYSAAQVILEAWSKTPSAEELATLESLLHDLAGYGGDEQWEGEWYPTMLILDSHFEDYAQEFAEECGMVNRESHWPNNHIDWKAAAEDMQQDYSQVNFGQYTYWYR